MITNYLQKIIAAAIEDLNEVKHEQGVDSEAFKRLAEQCKDWFDAEKFLTLLTAASQALEGGINEENHHLDQRC
ncbi:MAG TPA: hypothetical protein PK283_09580, partial [Thiotrichales bacterium]|nr:hypothetical protein [Thiotrichales bacterium]